MCKKFTGINIEMDEMLRAKQDSVCAKMFWILYLLNYAFFIVQALGLDAPFRATWPSFTLGVVGFIVYFVLALRHYIPLVPPVSKKTLLFLCFGSAIAMGIFVGVRNVFFLYAHNIQQYSFYERTGMAAQIAAIIALEVLALNLLELLALWLLSRWQNKRIEKHIAQENEE